MHYRREEMNIKKYITRKRVIMFMILLVLLVSSIIPFIRIISNKPLLIGELPYYDARISETILEKGSTFEDDLISGGRNYILKPHHLILAPLLYFFVPELTILIISFISGALSIVLFYLILKKLKMQLHQRFFILLILLLTMFADSI